LQDRNIAVGVLMTSSWPRIAKQVEKVAQEIETVGSGDYLEIEI
jgi:hypothetical protein